YANSRVCRSRSTARSRRAAVATIPHIPRTAHRWPPTIDRKTVAATRTVFGTGQRNCRTTLSVLPRAPRRLLRPESSSAKTVGQLAKVGADHIQTNQADRSSAVSDTLKELVQSGRLKTGTTLHHAGRRRGENAATATAVPNGLELDGRLY